VPAGTTGEGAVPAGTARTGGETAGVGAPPAQGGTLLHSKTNSDSSTLLTSRGFVVYPNGIVACAKVSVLYNTVHTVLYSTVLYYTNWRCAMLYGTVLTCTEVSYHLLCSAVCTILCRTKCLLAVRRIAFSYIPIVCVVARSAGDRAALPNAL